MISIDTLRADKVGVYGSKADITPMIDNLGEHGVVFRNAYSTAPWTLPAHASMFTGVYPTTHKAIDDKVFIDPKIPMLTELLKHAGYRTAGFVSHYYLSKDYGFDRGFDSFEMQLDEPAEAVTDKAIRWLKKYRKSSFFLFLHYFDPHTPYQPPIQFAKKHYPKGLSIIPGSTKDVVSVIFNWPNKQAKDALKALEALYEAEIDYTDSAIAKLYKKLQYWRMDQNTIIILVADHGEEFMDHGLMEHGFTLYEEQLRVPFIMYYPKAFKPHQVQAKASLIDLMPTLLDMLHIPIPKIVQGASLMPLINESGTPPAIEDRSLFGETTRQGPDRMCIIKNVDKFIYSPEFALNNIKFGRMLFDLKKDPHEKDDLIGKSPQLAADLEKKLVQSGHYAPRKAWVVKFAGAKDDKTVYSAMITTTGKFVYAFKHNSIYDVDAKGLIISREFPMKKEDKRIRFIAFANDGDNGLTFSVEPENASVTFHLSIGQKNETNKVMLGEPNKHPDQIPFSLSNDVKMDPKVKLTQPGYLIYSETISTFKDLVMRAEVGDVIMISDDMKEKLRSLGYIQ